MKKTYVNFVADSGAATASLEPNESRLAGNTRTRNKGLLSRLQARGPEALTDAELVAVVLAILQVELMAVLVVQVRLVLEEPCLVQVLLRAVAVVGGI